MLHLRNFRCNFLEMNKSDSFAKGMEKKVRNDKNSVKFSITCCLMSLNEKCTNKSEATAVTIFYRCV